jgi:hypothetical protein
MQSNQTMNAMHEAMIEAMIKTGLRQKMEKQLRCDMTIGMADENMEEYTEEEIAKFISDNNEEISKAIDEMYLAYEEDNDLESLEQPENDWIREYLYEHVDISCLDRNMSM